MRFEIRIDGYLEKKDPVLLVLLFTKKQEEYLNGCEKGIYYCASTVPDDRQKLISIIENSINACLENYFEDKSRNEI